jgi:hypothetical protein
VLISWRSARAFGALRSSADRQICARQSRNDCVELPGSWDAFEFVFAAVDELDAGAGDEHRHGGRGQQLSRGGVVEDAGGDMDADAGDVCAAPLDFAGVELFARRAARRMVVAETMRAHRFGYLLGRRLLRRTERAHRTLTEWRSR